MRYRKKRFENWFQGMGRFKRGTLILLTFLGVFMVLLVLVAAGWEYTNDPEFCSYTCHTMPPYAKRYEVSSHARVPCVSCHLGVGLSFGLVVRKSYDVTHIIKMITGWYEEPIRIKSLRPARETCEKCHWTEAFYADKIMEITHYKPDESNTAENTYMVMKTGGGLERKDGGFGIHWHVQNEVYYIATDETKQDIPWVKWVNSEGEEVIYIDQERKDQITPEFVERSEIRRMDCIDCHNRSSHDFPSPNETLDSLITWKKVDRGIPYIKKNAVEVMSVPYETQGEGVSAIDQLKQLYATDYAEYYSENKASVDSSIEEIKQAYRNSVFPEKEIDWNTYPNNVGHAESAGCFRCHDGKHVTQNDDVEPKRQSIRLHCNICHSIPVTVEEGEEPPAYNFETAAQPESHLAANWMAEHRLNTDETCVMCHDPAVSEEDGFCNNPNCHQTKWKYVGVGDVPMSFGCETCHDPDAGTAMDREGCLSCHAGIEETGLHAQPAHYDCVTCHVPHGWTPAPRETCESCHTDKLDHNPGIACAECHDFAG